MERNKLANGRTKKGDRGTNAPQPHLKAHHKKLHHHPLAQGRRYGAPVDQVVALATEAGVGLFLHNEADVGRNDARPLVTGVLKGDFGAWPSASR